MQKYRRLLQYARPQWRLFALILPLTIAASTLAALQPWPLALLSDCVLGSTPAPSALRSIFEAFSLEPTPGRLLAGIVVSGLVLFALNGVLEVGLTRAWTVRRPRMVDSVAEDLVARR